ncbi:hypothetical protein B0H17DRAFT_1074977 [Mycena rosella]|uniref:SIS domain-containing protein n=1 Tax=Mycena rosella TaxID=1033263 RepID=A0AAD7GA25_MYCRO|nr:hypothetical protein B0H17DRAFT_1074977 [Mycena rosella]
MSPQAAYDWLHQELSKILVAPESMPRASGPPELHELQTEQANPVTQDMDTLSTLEMCRLINAEDRRVAAAVEAITPTISQVIDDIVDRMSQGAGRLLYMGAGTSGRLGVLDLADIPTSFNVDPMRYIALTAGGDVTLRTAQPSVEDSRAAGAADLGSLLPTPQDTLIGISASGRTPYVLGALHSARVHGLLTVGIVCTRPSALLLEGECDYVLDPLVGPEVIAGSSRMKAGTATKMILNMISTAVQVKLGQTYGNLMVDVHPSNLKSTARARGIIRSMAASRAEAYSDDELDGVIARCGGSVKLAVVVVVSGWGVPLCVDALERRGGSLRSVLEDVRYETVVRVFV